MPTRGERARSALVSHAERLFAERGVDGVSLRDVSASAGQRNHSAAQYHFGDRAGLIGAVFAHRMVEVEAIRRTLLDQLDHSGNGSGDVEGPINVLIQPLAGVVCRADGWYARFLLRARWDPVSLDVIRGRPEAATYHEARARTGDALAHLPAPILRRRLDQIDDITLCGLADWEWSRDRGEARLDPDVLVDELVATSAAIAAAPVRSG